jgi:Ca-activated chloride channel family protein
VQYLKPGETTAHQVSLAVEIDAGVSIEEHECKTHRVSFEAPTPEKLLVKIDDSDKLPNRDFVLRYRVAGERVKTDFLAFRDQRGGYFTAMVYPPKEMTSLRRQPLELVFVLDCSGSMNGRPIAQSKAAVDRALDLLQPGDSFQLISFSMSASQFGSRPVEATDENVDRARAYLAGLKGEGGTMMIEGIKAALDFPHDPQRLRFVCFLTDGFIGNEAEILGEIRARLGAARIFSFGIGSSVNRFLIDEMAVAGRGAVAYLGLRDSAPRIMESFFERISHPALIDLSIDWGGLQVTEVYPRQLPDLFVGRPVILTGRLQGEWDGTIRVRGQAAGQRLEIPISAVTHENHPEAAALPSVWARMKIADLANRSTIEDVPNVAETVKQLALDYSLLSAYTAFVAVDSSRRTEGSEGTTVPVAVPVPEGVKYDTTVTEK